MSDFVSKWLSDKADPAFAAIAEYSEGGAPQTPLDQLLGLTKESQLPFTKALLSLPESEPISERLGELRKGFHAYLQFQDLLEVIATEPHFEARHYAYYESLVYLRETLICFISRRNLSALTLMRPFLELSITHLYWREQSRKRNSFDSYYAWLRGEKEKPPFRNMVEFVMSHLEARHHVTKARYRQIQHSLISYYKASCGYHHTPSPRDSVVTLSSGVSDNATYPFFVVLTELSLVLRSIVYLYVLANPMILFPKSIVPKFGYSPPVGLFVDETTASIVAEYLGSDVATTMQRQLAQCEPVPTFTSFYDERDLLPEHVLSEAWEEAKRLHEITTNVASDGQRWTVVKSTLRALGWVMNYVEKPDSMEWVPDEAIAEMNRYAREWPS